MDQSAAAAGGRVRAADMTAGHGPVLDFSRPLIMGVLNLTPDSFSDGGQHADQEAALAHALAMIGEGADLIDVGGESTRPGAEPVSPAEQCRRVLGVVRRLARAAPGVPISIDTSSATVAGAALEAGASLINDVSAGRHDPDMFALAADSGAPIVLMHMQGTPRTMHEHAAYADVVAEVGDFLRERAALARAAGIAREAILLDPGIGFGKRRAHNLALLARLDLLVASGYPVCLGASRKRFMGALCRGGEPASLVPATCAATALGVAAGVAMFRVHDVAANRQAADVAWAIREAGSDRAERPQA